MACFIVPAAQAIVTMVVAKNLLTKEKESPAPTTTAQTHAPISLARKLTWLTNLLWGGSILLAFEHIWHGEIVPWYPFLTAATNPADMTAMLYEMATVGVVMALLITAVWGGMVLAANHIAQRESSAHPLAK